jgi:SAM-dependent methyltransferase
MNHQCRICDTEGQHAVHEAQERMFGSGERFSYFFCTACECLQIGAIPADLEKYYPSSYYSFAGAPAAGGGRLRRLIRMRDAAAAGQDANLLGRALLHFKPNPPLQAVARTGARLDARIADVGCGAGRLLHELHALGYRSLTGIDPNIDADIVADDRLRIRKAFLEDVPGDFDLIMFHHSLEHIPDQHAVLRAAHAKLAQDGVCMVRVPLVSSQAWRTYGTHWVQLDAPRHLYLHSLTSMRALASRTGFAVDRVVFDSDEFQFWGSEALRRCSTPAPVVPTRPRSRSRARTAASGESRRPR